jgi:hypothetical protein
MPTILCFEAHRADGRVWSVRHRGKWHATAELVCQVPIVSRYRGRMARQPKAYFEVIGPHILSVKRCRISVLA